MASVIALDPLHRPMRLVLGYVPAHQQSKQNGQQVQYFFINFFCLQPRRPSGVRGDTVQILGRWQCPVALREALDPLYWSVLAVLCRRVSSAVETARIGGAFVCR